MCFFVLDHDTSVTKAGVNRAIFFRRTIPVATTGPAVSDDWIVAAAIEGGMPGALVACQWSDAAFCQSTPFLFPNHGVLTRTDQH